MNLKASEKEYEALYLQGIIAEWFLRLDQLELYDLIQDNSKVVVDCHRRLGKTTTTFTAINEYCLTNKIIVRIGGITQKSIKDIYSNVQDHIFRFAPKLMPKYDSRYDAFVFPQTGSRIYLFGNANSEENSKSRGSETDIVYCDEFGFWRFKPKETLYSVLVPQMQHSKLGKLIITSTMPKDLTHEYINQCAEARSNGYFFFQNIDDSVKKGVYTEEEYKKIEQSMGGRDSEDFKREYLLQEIASSKDLVIPEAQDEALFVGRIPRPAYYNAYMGMDLGLKDYTAAVFGFYNFDTAQLVIQKEYFEHYKSTEEIVFALKQIEFGLGYTKVNRVCDNEMQQLHDMAYMFGYHVSPVVKRKQGDRPYLESLINALRIAISTHRLIISPDCVNLISQLRYGLWNETRTDFERSETMGHLDALMALAYLWDNIEQFKNPYPAMPLDLVGKPKDEVMVVNLRRQKLLKDVF